LIAYALLFLIGLEFNNKILFSTINFLMRSKELINFNMTKPSRKPIQPINFKDNLPERKESITQSSATFKHVLSTKEM
jgi:hypothetical protein